MKVKVKSLSCVRLFVIPWIVAYQSPQSMEFSRQEYWNRLPFPSLGDLTDPVIEPWSPALQADALPSEPPGKPNIPQHNKSYIWQTHSKHYPKWWKIQSISPKVRNKTRVTTFTTTIQHSSGSFGHSNQSRKRNKRNPNWKRRSKTLIVCRWHDPLHRKP